MSRGQAGWPQRHADANKDHALVSSLMSHLLWAQKDQPRRFTASPKVPANGRLGTDSHSAIVSVRRDLIRAYLRNSDWIEKYTSSLIFSRFFPLCISYTL